MAKTSALDNVKSEIEKLVPEGQENRDDIVELLVDHVKYPDIFNVAPMKPSFMLNSNPLLTAIESVVGMKDAFGIYNKITAWKMWAPDEVLNGILQELFSTDAVDSAIYGRVGTISASDYGAPNGPVLGGWESDENQ